jgi:hypothetical protein
LIGLVGIAKVHRGKGLGRLRVAARAVLRKF